MPRLAHSAFSISRRRAFAPTPPATTTRFRPVAFSAASVFFNQHLDDGRWVDPHWPCPAAPRCCKLEQLVRTAVFRPANRGEVEVAAVPSGGRGKFEGFAVSHFPAARAPGRGVDSPIIFGGLSKASPAASQWSRRAIHNARRRPLDQCVWPPDTRRRQRNSGGRWRER